MDDIISEDQLKTNDSIPIKNVNEKQGDIVISPQHQTNADSTCQNCVSYIEDSFVYSIGKISFRFPTLSVEKEFQQIVGRTESQNLTDHQLYFNILSDKQNLYLLRKLCWIFSVEGVETYLLVPRYLADLTLFSDSLREQPKQTDIDVIIGVKGSLAKPTMCNGLILPIVFVDQIYSFDIDSLVKSIPKPKEFTAKEFVPVAEELFSRLVQIADNSGSVDEHRALNYLAVRYPAVYHLTVNQYARDFTMTSVNAIQSRLSGSRKVLDIIFSFTNRSSDFNEKYFCRVDITEEFPFLVTKLTQYFDRI